MSDLLPQKHRLLLSSAWREEQITNPDQRMSESYLMILPAVTPQCRQVTIVNVITRTLNWTLNSIGETRDLCKETLTQTGEKKDKNHTRTCSFSACRKRSETNNSHAGQDSQPGLLETPGL